MFQITSQKRYIQVKALESTALSDFIAAIQTLFAMPEYAHSNDLWVLSDGIIDLTFDQLGTLTEFIAANYPAGATRTKTALMVPPGLNTAISELWASTARDLPYTTRVFASLSEAIDWVTT